MAKTIDQIRDDILQSYYNGCIANNLTAPDIGTGSINYLRAQAYAECAMMVQDNALKEQLEEDVLTATGEKLDELANERGLIRKQVAYASCAASTGITVGTSPSIPIGTKYSDVNGQSFEVQSSYIDTASSTAFIYVRAELSGSTVASGDVLTIDRPIADVNTTATIIAIQDPGSEVESDDQLRRRLLAIDIPTFTSTASDLSRKASALDAVDIVSVYPAAGHDGTSMIEVPGSVCCLIKPRRYLTDGLPSETVAKVKDVLVETSPIGNYVLVETPREDCKVKVTVPDGWATSRKCPYNAKLASKVYFKDSDNERYIEYTTTDTIDLPAPIPSLGIEYTSNLAIPSIIVNRYDGYNVVAKTYTVSKYQLFFASPTYTMRLWLTSEIVPHYNDSYIGTDLYGNYYVQPVNTNAQQIIDIVTDVAESSCPGRDLTLSTIHTPTPAYNGTIVDRLPAKLIENDIDYTSVSHLVWSPSTEIAGIPRLLDVVLTPSVQGT